MSFKGVTKETTEAVREFFNHCCGACGMADPDHLEVDHVQPRSFYDFRKIPVDSTMKNVQVLCAACNKIKGSAEYVTKCRPRVPEYDLRAVLANRAVWRETVRNVKDSQKLF